MRGCPGFPLVDRYMGTRMGIDLSALVPGCLVVTESCRRLRREESYGFVHVLWWVWRTDGCSAVSVVPGAGKVVKQIAKGVRCAGGIHEARLARTLQGAVDAVLVKRGMKPSHRVLTCEMIACDASRLRRHAHGDCRRLRNESVPPADGLRLPSHCFPDGIVYGIMADAQVVSVAYAHRAGLMEHQVADVAVETASGYRRRGYAQTAVSAVVANIALGGGEARYACRPDNRASIATARSVGFVPYAKELVLSAPCDALPAAPP